MGHVMSLASYIWQTMPLPHIVQGQAQIHHQRSRRRRPSLTVSCNKTASLAETIDMCAYEDLSDAMLLLGHSHSLNAQSGSDWQHRGLTSHTAETSRPG